MNWKFWEKEKEHPLNADMNQLKQQSEQMQEQIANIENQVQKLTRLQYKTGKNTEEQLNTLSETMERTKQASGESDKEIIPQLIRQIDDMDMVSAQLKNDPNWQALIQKWSERLLHTLADLGVKESIHHGDMFDPKRTEAIEAVLPPEPQARPYQIVHIHQRGFYDKDGTIIRKAQVTTVKEDAENG
ncbi:nucleotide exchange factor GrpE [Salicibibacter cibarius]|uniref:Nucleotide exchange factor GrpE n=1 Tax=Salicibibacter cibarius TaxID=2743000 RepID=A0A7T6Z1I5_9BACI|nr:nucleotide exchange factor GrpE [Salicibibacter cibarius]QQK74952.1 nucleotide exchange factor GrpE [Salicibibacter cibarius]